MILLNLDWLMAASLCSLSSSLFCGAPSLCLSGFCPRSLTSIALVQGLGWVFSFALVLVTSPTHHSSSTSAHHSTHHPSTSHPSFLAASRCAAGHHPLVRSPPPSTFFSHLLVLVASAPGRGPCKPGSLDPGSFCQAVVQGNASRGTAPCTGLVGSL